MEGLGSVSVICSDKTGTLTQNKMTVKKLCTGGQIIPGGRGGLLSPGTGELLRAALLCSDATVNESGEVGDPTETALVRLGESYGFDEAEARGKYPRLAELPFDSDRKLMSTVHQLPDGLTMLDQGAVDVLLDRTWALRRRRAEIERMNEELSQQGLRVLAFAGKRMLTAPAIGLEDENDLHLPGPHRHDGPAPGGVQGGRRWWHRRRHPAHHDHRRPQGHRLRHRQGDRHPHPRHRGGGGRGMEAMSDEELEEFVPEVSVYARVSRSTRSASSGPGRTGATWWP